MSPRKDHGEKPGTGLIREAPEIVPVLEMDETVIFPSSTLPVFLTSDPETPHFLARLKANAYLIIQPSAEDDASGNFPIGVLGIITNLDESNSEQPVFNFNGLYRVFVEQVEKEDGITMAKHKPVIDIPLLEEDLGHQDFQKSVLLLRDNFPIAFALFTHRVLDIRNAQDFLEKKFVQDAMIRMKNLDAENITSAIDGVMNVLNHAVAMMEAKRIHIREASLIILAEPVILLRLKYFMSLLNALFAHESAQTVDGSNEEMDELQARYEEIKERIPDEVKKEIEKEFGRMQRAHASEASKSQDHLELLLGMPWGVYTEDRQDLGRAHEILNERHSGLDKIKERILESIAVRQLNPSAKAPILCFVGPPGVGKTSLGQAIADALGRKFIRVSLGGMRDENFLKGFDGTYISSKEGHIIQEIKRCGSSNPVFMIDEVDKIGEDYRGDPADALLEVLDPEQNNAFFDRYLNVHFDLSNIFFIATANIFDSIRPALLDRMEVIELPGYTPLEKLQIAKDHLIPRRRKENGFPIITEGREPIDISFTDGAILAVVHQYTREAGVRNLEREFARPFRKIGKAFKSGDIPAESITLISEENLRQFMGKPSITEHMTLAVLPAGVVPVLAVSDTGGHVFQIEVAISHHVGSRKIIMQGVRDSGSNKDSVNKIEESLKIAFDALTTEGRILFELVREREAQFGPLLVTGNMTNSATPKDGPSAGVSALLALYGALTKQSIKPTDNTPLLAATGEITMSLDAISAIGGVRDKILAAHRYGIRRAIIPEQNAGNIEDIPEEISGQMEIRVERSMLKALACAYPNDERIRKFIELQNQGGSS